MDATSIFNIDFYVKMPKMLYIKKFNLIDDPFSFFSKCTTSSVLFHKINTLKLETKPLNKLSK